MSEFTVWCYKTQRMVKVRGYVSPGRVGATRILHVEDCIENCPYKNSVDCLIKHEIEGAW